MSAGADSFPAAAAANNWSSGMLAQIRYDRRDAISQLSRGTTCDGFGELPSVTVTVGLLVLGGLPNSTRYRNCGDCSAVSITKRTPVAKSVALPALNTPVNSAVSAAVSGRR